MWTLWEPDRPGRPRNYKRHQQIVTLYKTGATIFEIADRFGVTPQAIHSVLKRNGVTRRDGGAHVRAAPERLQKIVARFELEMKRIRSCYMRDCAKCKIRKPVSEFTQRNKKGDKHAYCRACRAAAVSRWYHEGGGRKKMREWQQNNKDKCREYTRRHREKKQQLAAEVRP